ncbi:MULTISPECIES: hypothetical protein [Nocardia]|uniref:Uncharacterized protein n=2 Tax=Nocardia TaxID=1817 RepID=A0A2T2YQM3_9NOCA|nr:MULTISPECIES: hypothetical protein [Nocardia]MBF6242234.1 hypothetical protein [Nocardia elegans]MBF6446935.1 hypothetical protein [Nocardia elegans]PSR57820.1 hypothetical protein C8259_33060 [Nocardia nova]
MSRLATSYTAYTSDDEMNTAPVFGTAAPATTPLTPELAVVLVRATLIAQSSSQGCAIALAGGTPNVAKTIKSVC